MNRHMKAEDLQIGDWVQLFPDQCRVDGIICLREVHTAEEKWMAIVHLGGNKYERVNVDILEPIPLTHDILEKNGFTNYDVGHKVKGWTIMDEEYCSDIPFTLTDNDFDTEQEEAKYKEKYEKASKEYNDYKNGEYKRIQNEYSTQNRLANQLEETLKKVPDLKQDLNAYGTVS